LANQFKDAVKNRDRIADWVKDQPAVHKLEEEQEKQKELIQPLVERNRRRMEGRDPEKMRLLNYQIADSDAQVEKMRMKKKTY